MDRHGAWQKESISCLRSRHCHFYCFVVFMKSLCNALEDLGWSFWLKGGASARAPSEKDVSSQTQCPPGAGLCLERMSQHPQPMMPPLST